MQTISQTIRLRPNGRYREVIERGRPSVYYLIVWSWMMYVGGRMNNIGRSRSLRRYFGIQVGSCAGLRRCTTTCLRELNNSTDTCMTSLDLRHMFFLCGLLTFHSLSLTFILTPLRKKVGVSRQEIYHDGLRMDICHGIDGCFTLRFCHLLQDLL